MVAMYLRPTWIVVQHAPQRGNVLREGVLPHEHVVPDGTQEIVLLNNAAGSLQEGGKGVERFRRQRNRLIVPIKSPEPAIEFVRSEVVVDGRFVLPSV